MEKELFEAAKFVTDMAKRSSDLAKFDGVRRNPAIKTDSLEELYKGSRTKYLSDDDKFAIMIGNFFLSGENYQKYYVPAKKIMVKAVSE